MGTWVNEQIEVEFCQKEDRYFITCTSQSPRIRAMEYMDYLLDNHGIVKGDANQASGELPVGIMSAWMGDVENPDPEAFLQERSQRYFTDTDVVESATYVDENKGVLDECGLYQKKPIPWAYVKTTDLAAPGKDLYFRTLENSDGVQVKAREDLYIMIGCRGEVYHMEQSKFEATYEKSEEPLDVFEQMMDFIPEVKIVNTDEYMTIDEKAKLCYPKATNQIYAKELLKRTRIYTLADKREYFLGNQGDFMAIRCDDLQDIYVIRRNVFQITYESAK